jgi:hypothetical protein
MENSLIGINERTYLVLTGAQKHLKLSYACAFLEKMQHCWPKGMLFPNECHLQNLALGNIIYILQKTTVFFYALQNKT